MAAVEFQATIRDGVIQVPAEYMEQFTDGVRVILMADTSRRPTDTMLDDLLAHPLKMSGFHPMTRDAAHERS